jgi:uncharacterized protein YyaL (SSP411 family)
MVGVLARLHLLTGERRFEDRARALIKAFSGELERKFFPLATYLNNAAFLAHALEVVIIGAHDAPDTSALVEVVMRHSLPDRLLQVVPPDATLPETHPAFGKTQQQGRATAYLCRDRSCGLPITEAGALDAALSTRLAAA